MCKATTAFWSQSQIRINLTKPLQCLKVRCTFKQVVVEMSQSIAVVCQWYVLYTVQPTNSVGHHCIPLSSPHYGSFSFAIPSLSFKESDSWLIVLSQSITSNFITVFSQPRSECHSLIESSTRKRLIWILEPTLYFLPNFCNHINMFWILLYFTSLPSEKHILLFSYGCTENLSNHNRTPFLKPDNVISCSYIPLCP